MDGGQFTTVARHVSHADLDLALNHGARRRRKCDAAGPVVLFYIYPQLGRTKLNAHAAHRASGEVEETARQDI